MTEPKPWPRAQTMPFVTVGERVQPHHHQAIAEYDETRGETTPRHHSPSMYTATHINQAIEWWNKRAELEAAVVPAPMSDERLADVRAQVSEGAGVADFGEQRAWDIAADLLAEVDRLRALDVPARFLHVDPEDVTPEQIAEWQAAWNNMLATNITMYDLTPLPRDPDWWTPMRNRIPRSNEHPAGG